MLIDYLGELRKVGTVVTGRVTFLLKATQKKPILRLRDLHGSGCVGCGPGRNYSFNRGSQSDGGCPI